MKTYWKYLGIVTWWIVTYMAIAVVLIDHVAGWIPLLYAFSAPLATGAILAQRIRDKARRVVYSWALIACLAGIVGMYFHLEHRDIQNRAEAADLAIDACRDHFLSDYSNCEVLTFDVEKCRYENLDVHEYLTVFIEVALQDSFGRYTRKAALWEMDEAIWSDTGWGHPELRRVLEYDDSAMKWRSAEL